MRKLEDCPGSPLPDRQKPEEAWRREGISDSENYVLVFLNPVSACFSPQLRDYLCPRA